MLQHSVAWADDSEECGFEYIYLMMRNKVSRKDSLWEWKHEDFCKLTPQQHNKMSEIVSEKSLEMFLRAYSK